MSQLKRLLDFLKPNKQNKIVLSLDGGGVRAIAQIVFLKNLEVEIGKPLIEIFDLYVGTSAGAVNAACIGAQGMSCDSIEEVWSQESLNQTMSKSFWDNASFLQARPKYDGTGKHQILKKFFQDQSLGESKRPLVVLAYDVEKRQPRILSSYGTPGIKVVSALTASSAAPIYYPTEQVEDGSWLIDGGIAANNPSLVGYSEAASIFPNSNIKVLSIGTGINRRKINGLRSRKWGALSWFRNDILGIMLESSLHHEIMINLIGQNYLRVNSPLESVNRRMDDNSESNLKRIHLMGMEWWSTFKEKAIDFVKK